MKRCKIRKASCVKNVTFENIANKILEGNPAVKKIIEGRKIKVGLMNLDTGEIHQLPDYFTFPDEKEDTSGIVITKKYDSIKFRCECCDQYFEKGEMDFCVEFKDRHVTLCKTCNS